MTQKSTAKQKPEIKNKSKIACLLKLAFNHLLISNRRKAVHLKIPCSHPVLPPIVHRLLLCLHLPVCEIISPF